MHRPRIDHLTRKRWLVIRRLLAAVSGLVTVVRDDAVAGELLTPANVSQNIVDIACVRFVAVTGFVARFERRSSEANPVRVLIVGTRIGQRIPHLPQIVEHRRGHYDAFRRLAGGIERPVHRRERRSK